jgi:hypothetical protein
VGVSADLACADAEGDPLGYVVRTAPAGGTLTHDGSTFTYLPDAGFAGVDTFTVAAGDGLRSTEFRVSVTVAAPVAAAPAPAVEPPAAAAPAAPSAEALQAPPPAAAMGLATMVGRATMAGGAISIALRCTGPAVACRGSARLSATLRGRARALGTRALALAAATRASIRVRIPQRARAALGGLAGRTIALRVVLASDAGGRVVTVTPLHVPR